MTGTTPIPIRNERALLLPRRPSARSYTLTNTIKKTHLDNVRVLLAFFLELQIGMAEAALGSLLESMQLAYGLSYRAVGFVTLVDALGRGVGTASAPFAVHSFGLPLLLYGSSALLALSSTLPLFAPPWAVVLLSIALTGLASGALEPALATYIAHFHAPALMSFVFAGEGLGALIQPFLVSGLIVREWEWDVYFWVPLALALLDLPLVWMLFGDYKSPKHEDGAEQNSVKRWLKVAINPVVICGGILQALAYSAEDIITTWIGVFMCDIRGGPPARMQYVLTGYWAGQALSRTFLADLARRYSPRFLLTFYLLIGTTMLVALQASDSILADGILVALFGFFLGPAIPTVITTVCAHLIPSQVDSATSVLLTAGVLGSGGAPVVVGFVNSAGGLRWMPLAMILCLLATVGVWEGFWTAGWMDLPEEKEGECVGERGGGRG